jgi:hypothetical protein
VLRPITVLVLLAPFLLSLPLARADASTPGGPTVIALLANNRLVMASSATGRIIAQQELMHGPVPSTLGVKDGQFRGFYLALSNDQRTLYALVLDATNGSHHLAVIDVRTHQVHAYYPMEQDVLVRAIAVGPQTGRVYLFGERVSARPQSVVVLVLHPRSGRLLARWTVRKTGNLDWKVFRGLTSADERQLFIDYWRGAGYGIDVVNTVDGHPIPCGRPAPSRIGCGHSDDFFVNVELYRARLVVAHGTVPGEGHPFVELDSSGTIRRTLRNRLPGDPHTGDFVVDQTTGALYEVGSCGYTGGLNVIDLKTGHAQAIVPPLNYNVCGERIATGPHSLLAIGKIPGSVIPRTDSPGALLLVDGRSGKLLHSIETPAGAVDIIVAK